TSPGRGLRVVTDTDMRRPLSLASRRRASVVLPAPDGEESTSSRPRRATCGRSDRSGRAPASLNVLHLLAHLVDDRLELQSRPGRFRIVGLGADGVGLAIELLGEEIETAAGGLFRSKQLARAGDVGAEALQLLLYVGPRRQHGGFLVEAALVEARTRVQQTAHLLLEPLPDRLGRARRRPGNGCHQALDRGDLLAHRGLEMASLGFTRAHHALER